MGGIPIIRLPFKCMFTANQSTQPNATMDALAGLPEKKSIKDLKTRMNQSN